MSVMRSSCAILTVILVLPALAAKPKLTINIKDKDVVNGIMKVKATVDPPNVDRVIFEVEGMEPTVDQSTPYEFDWDTLLGAEGAQKLSVSVQMDDGSTSKFEYSVTVDNELSKGLEHHLGRARDFLRDSKWEEAYLATRVARKIDDKSVPAIVAQARAMLMLTREVDNVKKAKRLLDRAVELDPKSVEAAEALTVVSIRMAFEARSKDDEREGFLTAVRNRLNSLNTQISAITSDVDPRKVELQLMVGDYSLAIKSLKLAIETNRRDPLLHNSLLYAYLRDGQMAEARKAAARILERKIEDEYTHSLIAVIAAMSGDTTGATDAINKAAKENPDAPIVKLAQAYVAIQQSRPNYRTSQSRAAELISAGHVFPEVYYYQSVALWATGAPDEARDAFKAAILQDPAMTDFYVQRGYENLLANRSNIARDQKDNAKIYMNAAKQYFEIALASRGSSPEALVGSSLTHAFNNEIADAVKLAEGVYSGLRTDRAWPFVAAAAVFEWAAGAYGRALLAESDPEKKLQYQKTEADLRERARRSQVKAVNLDRDNVADLSPKSLDDALRFVMRWGRTPVLIRPLVNRNATTSEG